ncbi:S41 family peptidase [Sphingomonas koreensis]
MIGLVALLLAGASPPPADKAHEELTLAIARVEGDSLARVSRQDVVREAGRWLSRVPGLDEADRVEPVIDSDAALLLHFDMLCEKYSGKIDERRFVAAAMDGMIAATAQPGHYVDVAALQTLEQSGAASIGVSVKFVDHKLIVDSTLSGSPAEATLLAGDVIEQVDGTAMAGVSIDEAVRLFRGEPGTSVTLSVRRGSGGPVEIRVSREIRRNAPDISWEMKNGIGVLRILRFSNRTLESANRALADMRQTGEEVRGYVVDLRGNEGGLFRAVVDVGDAFIDKGTIGRLAGRAGVEEVFRARRGDLLKGAPLVVVVDGKTASGAEMFAAGLKESGRACVVGSSTRGVGQIQSILLLNDRSALRLTTGEFLTGAGAKIEGSGIKPDVVTADRGDAGDIPLQMAERLLSNPKFACIAPDAASASTSIDMSSISQRGR